MKPIGQAVLLFSNISCSVVQQNTKEHSNTYFLILSSSIVILFCFGKPPTHKTYGGSHDNLLSCMHARLVDIRWKCVSEGAEIFSPCSRSAFGPRVSGRGITDNLGAYGIVCRLCTKTKQNGNRSRNRKQIPVVSAAVFPCSRCSLLTTPFFPLSFPSIKKKTIYNLIARTKLRTFLLH